MGVTVNTFVRVLCLQFMQFCLLHLRVTRVPLRRPTPTLKIQILHVGNTLSSIWTTQAQAALFAASELSQSRDSQSPYFQKSWVRLPRQFNSPRQTVFWNLQNRLASPLLSLGTGSAMICLIHLLRCQWGRLSIRASHSSGLRTNCPSMLLTGRN